jgi:uncharacterized protein YnzC (UPF0291/DUF896 family)
MNAAVKEKLTFEEKVGAGEYNVKYLTSLKSDLKAQLSSGIIKGTGVKSAQEKIAVISRWLSAQMTTMPVETTRKTITLNNTRPKLVGSGKIIDDEDVARKFLYTKDGAKARGIEFSLNLVSVKNLLKAKKCFYTGLPFDHTDPESSLTFDRLDYKKGYIKGNVVACRKSVNDLKNVLIEHPVSVFKDNPTLLLKAVEKWII